MDTYVNGDNVVHENKKFQQNISHFNKSLITAIKQTYWNQIEKYDYVNKSERTKETTVYIALSSEL